MFIASSYMLYSPSPSGLTGSAVGVAPGGLLTGTSGHLPASAFAAPPLYRGQAPVKKAGGGFSVSDILQSDHRSDSVQQQPRTAACVVVSRRSPSCASSDTRSLSPATPPPAMTTGRPTSVSPPRFSRLRLKFGIDRILAQEGDAERYKGSYGDCAPSPSSFARLHHRLPVSDHAPSGACSECALPFCDGGVFHPLRYAAAYPAAALAAHHIGYPACAVYPAPPHLTSDLDPLLRSHHLHHHHHHVHHPSAAAGSGTGSDQRHLSSSSCTSGKRKRSWSRAVFSNLQRKGLEKRFQIQKYITKPDRRQLAATLGLTDAQVKVWFQNRRMKWRHSKEAKEEMNKQTTTSKTDSKTTCDLKANNSNNLKNHPTEASASIAGSEGATTAPPPSKNGESQLAGAPLAAAAAVGATSK